MSKNRYEKTIIIDGKLVDPLTSPLSASTKDRFIDQGRKAWAMRLAGGPFIFWLLALAKIADPTDPASWIAGCVVLNEDCWFEYFAEGLTPAECWDEELSNA